MVPKAITEFLSQINYLYTFLDLTKFSNWHKDLNEFFVCVRVGEALIPVYIDLTGSEVEFVGRVPEGSGFALADGAFDAKKVLNELVEKGYLPVVKPTKRKPDDFGSKIRDMVFDGSIYRLQERRRKILRSFKR